MTVVFCIQFLSKRIRKRFSSLTISIIACVLFLTWFCYGLISENFGGTDLMIAFSIGSLWIVVAIIKIAEFFERKQ
jgi:TRAP-type C4-dicarboxylate transport system permease small subunit